MRNSILFLLILKSISLLNPELYAALEKKVWLCLEWERNFIADYTGNEIKSFQRLFVKRTKILMGIISQEDCIVLCRKKYANFGFKISIKFIKKQMFSFILHIEFFKK